MVSSLNHAAVVREQYNTKRSHESLTWLERDRLKKFEKLTNANLMEYSIQLSNHGNNFR